MTGDTPPNKKDWNFQVVNSFVRNVDLSVGARLLYIIIKGYVGPNCAQPFPTLFTLSKNMGRERKCVQRYLNELEKSGWLRRHRYKNEGKFSATRYELIIAETKNRRDTMRLLR